MQELDFFEPAVNNWLATMKVIEDGLAVEKEWFDCSVDVEYYVILRKNRFFQFLH